MADAYDFLIVGAGFSGLVAAERLCNDAGQRCLVVEKRSHIGGNAYDCYDSHGVLIHAYGPHYFRTNAPRVRDYLSRFTGWHEVAYEIRAWARGRLWHFPINLNTFEELLGRPASTPEMEDWLAARREPLDHSPRNSEEVIVSQVGREFYELFFEGYTLKQWRRHPRELDASVCGRIPIRTNRDNRYLAEDFQALPAEGYTRMFERMIATSGNRLRILLDTDYRSLGDSIRWRHMIYTGPVDEYFGKQFGPLPYRSLRFERESFTGSELVAAGREAIAGKPGYWQPVMQVNYPGSEPFTRIVEIKHATGQQIDATTIIREFPEDFSDGREPYYPIPSPEARALHSRYKELADAESNVSFIGRLATYRYYNMDQVVAMALAEYDRLRQRYAL